MKTLTKLAGVVLLATILLLTGRAFAQPTPGSPNPNRLLDSWSFTSNNWFSDYGYAPVAFSNILNLTNILWLDTADASPAYLFYNVIETNGFTNITCDTGTISLWFKPDWTSTDQGGSGPGDYANLISLGEYGTNGSSWWAWYFDPTGTTLNFASQTNYGSPSFYFSAPVSLSSSNWCNLVLTYSPTNTAIYTNGVLVTNGSGVAYWPGSDVTNFAIGSDDAGLHQAEAEFSGVQSFNYPLDAYSISGNFEMYSIFYGFYTPAPVARLVVTAPSTNAVIPTFRAVIGAGFLTPLGTSATYPTSSNIWITNYAATMTASNVLSIQFAIAGGTNGIAYDIFASPAILSPITNATWYWQGQGYRGTNYSIAITNIPATGVYLILGQPTDSDSDGLTDAYERLVSHTNPYVADSAGSGMLDGWSVIYGLNPNADNSQNSALRANYTYDPVGRLDLLSGWRTETLTNDFEGNILQSY